MLSFDLKKYAGLITISGDSGRFTRWITKNKIWHGWSLHLFVYKNHSQWGFDESWYDGPYYSFGCGRLFLFCAF